EGLRHLREGDKDKAYAAFLQAKKSGQQLEPHRARQLREFLRDLSATRANGVRQVSNENPIQQVHARGTGTNPSTKIEIAEQQRAVKFEKLRTEVLNAHFRAERLREANPDQAMEAINKATAEVENSELGKDAV